MGPSQPPQNPKKSNFLNFYHNQSSIPFHIVQMSNGQLRLSLYFFTFLKIFCPKWAFFGFFLGWPYLKKGLIFFKALLPMGWVFVAFAFSFFLPFLSNDFLGPRWWDLWVFWRVVKKWASWGPFFGGKWPLWGQVCSVTKDGRKSEFFKTVFVFFLGATVWSQFKKGHRT